MMRSGMLRAATIAALVWFGAVPAASADPDAATVQAARESFEKGNAAYNLGRFDEAITWFTKAYETWPNSDFLYNIAQSYRLAGNCKQALFVYKRYLSLKDKDKEAPLTRKERQEIERFIKELTSCAAKADSTASRPPDTLKGPKGPMTTTTPTPTTPTTTTPPPTTTTPAPTTAPTTAPPTPTGRTPSPTTTAARDAEETDEEEELETDVGVSAQTEVGTARVIAARATAGIAKFGAGELSVPVQAAFGIGAGYPLAFGKVTLDLGARASFSPIAYDTMTETKNASLIGVRATVGATYHVAPKIGLRADVGVGIVHLGGLVEGNPFTDTREAGSFTMLSVRAGVAAEYYITRNVIAHVAPFAFAFSPAPDDLYMSSLTEIDVALGVGYRM